METISTSTTSVANEFRNFKHEKVLAEYIWNSFDADASIVNINYAIDDLGTIQSLLIIDNGKGIEKQEHKNTFGQFKDSPKQRISSPTIKGKKGLGRFSFHKIARKAIWDTVTEIDAFSIEIESDSLNNYNIIEKRNIFTPSTTGTQVELIGVSESNLTNDFIKNKVEPILKQEFSWLLASDSKKKIYLNNSQLEILDHIKTEDKLNINDHEFNISTFIWSNKPKDASYIYFSNSSGKIIYKTRHEQDYKSGLYFSLYIKSIFFDSFKIQPNDLASENKEADISVYEELKEKIKYILMDMHFNLRSKAADKLIEQYEKEGVFPENKEDSAHLKSIKHNSLKNTIKVLYSADPHLFSAQLNKTQKKIIVKLLDKISFGQSDDLFEILNGVISLTHEDQAKLAKTLKETTIKNITNAIAEVKERQKVIEIIKSLNEDHTKTTKEVGEIQSIIENNLWVFGEQYHLLTAEEADFEKSLKELLSIHGNEEFYQKGTVNHPDKNKEMDIFAVRRSFDVDENGKEFYRCLIIELKRPSDTLKDKHYNQIMRYYSVISSDHSFNDGCHKFDFILAGRKITDDPTARTMINMQLENSKSHGEAGLLSKMNNFKVYIKTWGQVISEHDIRHKYLLKHLDFNREKISQEKTDLVNQAVAIGEKISRE